MSLKMQCIDSIDLIAQTDYGTCDMQEVSEHSGKLLEISGSITLHVDIARKRKQLT